jgi:ion channel
MARAGVRLACQPHLRTQASALAGRGRNGDASGVTRRVGLERYLLLLLVTMLSLGVQGIADPGAVQRVVVTGLAGASLVLAFGAARVSPRAMRVVAAVAALALAVSILRATAGGVGDGATRLMNALLLALGPPAVAVAVVRDLRATNEVRVEAVVGVLTLYMLIGMAFGFLYGAIDRLGGDPFFGTGHEATVSHCLYFSFTTLATVGYGDLVARSDFGHTLAVFEALLGQIYLVTVVSVVISNLRRPARPPDRVPDRATDRPQSGSQPP